MLSKFDNRTHPMFLGQSCLNSLNLGITTFCTMKCPNCSVAVPKLKYEGTAEHALIADVFRTAAYMQRLKRVHVTGGEPTFHPDFVFLAQHLRAWFECEYLTIETNGTLYDKYRDVFQSNIFDLVFITHYEKDAIYKDSPDNTRVLEIAERDLGERLIREAPVRHDRMHQTLQLGVTLRDYADQKVEPCSKYTQLGLPAGWYHNKLYRCCVSFGIDQDLGIPVTNKWREEIVKLDMGCGMCLYKGT